MSDPNKSKDDPQDTENLKGQNGADRSVDGVDLKPEEQDRPDLDEDGPDADSGTDVDAAGDTDSDQDQNLRSKLAVLLGVVLLLGVAGVGYLAWSSGRASDSLLTREDRARQAVAEFEASLPPATATPTWQVREAERAANVDAPTLTVSPGDTVFVNNVPGDDYGRLGVRRVDGTRLLLDRTCIRVHVAGERGFCMSANEDPLFQAHQTSFFDLANPEITTKSYGSALPSRARMSPDGSLASATAFISGASYADIGGEAATIVTIDTIDGSRPLLGAAQFAVDSDDDRYNSGSGSYWGLTFVDNNDFYITGFYGEEPEIMSGSISDRTVTPTGWEGSCPSVSPDGKTLVFKEAREGGGFDLVAVDLESGDKWTLGETRSVDDQVEWRDESTIVYALHTEDGDRPIQPEWDLWSLDISEGSSPQLFLPNASSPAAIR